MPKTITLKCPCCGGVAAEADGIETGFTDGQGLDCGCSGHLSIIGDEVFPWVDDVAESRDETICTRCYWLVEAHSEHGT